MSRPTAGELITAMREQGLSVPSVTAQLAQELEDEGINPSLPTQLIAMTSALLEGQRHLMATVWELAGALGIQLTKSPTEIGDIHVEGLLLRAQAQVYDESFGVVEGVVEDGTQAEAVGAEASAEGAGAAE